MDGKYINPVHLPCSQCYNLSPGRPSVQKSKVIKFVVSLDNFEILGGSKSWTSGDDIANLQNQLTT